MSNMDLLYCYSLQEDHPIMSFTMDESGRRALVNVSSQVSEIIKYVEEAIFFLLYPN